MNETFSVGCTDEQTIVILSHKQTVEIEKTTLEALQERWHTTQHTQRLDHDCPMRKLVSIKKLESAFSHTRGKACTSKSPPCRTTRAPGSMMK